MGLAKVLFTAALLGSVSSLPVQAQTSIPSELAVPYMTLGSQPALVVTLVVDQFSANLFNQYRSRFTGGMRTLIDEGLVYANGYQAQGITKTCPGHSTVLSGAFPTHTGIPSNEWIDPVSGKEVYCLAAPHNTLADGGEGENGRVGPDNLRVTLLPDWLKAQSPSSRVFAVSGKDRGAINLAGHTPDGAYWIKEGFGLTTYVEPGQTAEERLAPVAEFNAAYRARYEAEPLPQWTYQHAECRALRGTLTVADTLMKADLPPENYNLEDSPALDETTIAAAIDLLDRQQLGRRGVTDMLGVGLSAIDKIGHSYGTQGPEMCEQMHRMDEALTTFFDKLAAVPGGVVLVLTADHGGSDAPERMATNGSPLAGRYDRTMLPRINDALKAEFGLDYAPLQQGGTGLIIADKDHVLLPEPMRARIVAAALPMLNANRTVTLAVATADLIRDPMPPADTAPEALSVRERLRLSAVEASGADIYIAYAPYLSSTTRAGGAISSHGSVWDYDRRVPIIFWTPGGQRQERFWQIRTVDIAPTLASLIAAPVPATVDGRCLETGLVDGAKCPAVQVATAAN